MMSTEYAAAVAFLLGLKRRGVSLGLDRMRRFAAALDHPETAIPCLHVAGTNGKGSVAAMLESVLRAAGWRVGLYTSPHLVRLGERIQVNRRIMTESELAAHVTALRPVVAGLEEAPSYFEFMTGLAFLHFARAGCDIAVIEVGLGGRLDATNIVTPEVSVITSIGLDHCEILGETLTAIAAEKAGIIKPAVPVVIGRLPPAAERAVREIALERSARVIAVSDEFGDEVARCPRTNLAGDYQRWNAAVATLVARQLPARWRLDADAIDHGLSHVDWPGRWQEIVVGSRRVILDTSHNPEGAQVLGANLIQLSAATGRKPIVVMGALGSARARALLEVIGRRAREIHLVVPDQSRACSHAELAALVPAEFAGRVVRTTVAEVFPDAHTCAVGSGDDVVVVTGSVYLVGETLARIGASPHAGESRLQDF